MVSNKVTRSLCSIPNEGKSLKNGSHPPLQLPPPPPPAASPVTVVSRLPFWKPEHRPSLKSSSRGCEKDKWETYGSPSEARRRYKSTFSNNAHPLSSFKKRSFSRAPGGLFHFRRDWKPREETLATLVKLTLQSNPEATVQKAGVFYLVGKDTYVLIFIKLVTLKNQTTTHGHVPNLFVIV